MTRTNYIVVVAGSTGERLKSLLQDEAERHNAAVENGEEPDDGLSKDHQILLVFEPLDFRHLKFVDAVIASSEGFGDLRDPTNRRHTLLVCRALIARTLVVMGKRSEAGESLLRGYKSVEGVREPAEPNAHLGLLSSLPYEPTSVDVDWPNDTNLVEAARSLTEASIFRSATSKSAVFPPLAGSKISEQREWFAKFACYGRSGLCSALSQLLPKSVGEFDSKFVQTFVKKYVEMYGDDVLAQARAYAVDNEDGAIEAIEAALEALVQRDVRVLTDLDLSGASDDVKSVMRALIPQLDSEDVEIMRPFDPPHRAESSIALTLSSADELLSAAPQPIMSAVGKIIVAQKVEGMAGELGTDAFIGHEVLGRLIGKVRAAHDSAKWQIEEIVGSAVA